MTLGRNNNYGDKALPMVVLYFLYCDIIITS